MLETIKQIRTAMSQDRPSAYCRLVETRGSTPQKAGAMMLVFGNGDQAGTLGGGCVEAEVKRNALRVLQTSTPQIATFQLDHDYGWDDGLICGGRMTVLIEPIASEDSRQYYEQLVTLAESQSGFTEAIVFQDQQSQLPVPSSLLFDGDGILQATLHCDEDASTVVQGLKPLATRPRPYTTAGVAFLPVLKRCRLIIVGGGHVGQAVADLTAALDFEVCVTDDRESIVSEERFPKADERIAGPCAEVLPTLTITPDTYCLIVTRGHSHDKEALYHLVDRGARYLGMIGSRRKIKLIFEDLMDEGISAELLDNVHAPVGIDIGSQTVPEIAVSIVAELISHRNCGGRIPGRPARVLANS